MAPHSSPFLLLALYFCWLCCSISVLTAYQPVQCKVLEDFVWGKAEFLNQWPTFSAGKIFWPSLCWFKHITPEPAGWFVYMLWCRNKWWRLAEGEVGRWGGAREDNGGLRVRVRGLGRVPFEAVRHGVCTDVRVQAVPLWWCWPASWREVFWCWTASPVVRDITVLKG